ncbi:MAG: 16S rRNA (guanine(966)-N(2))-methyltransferase RsmD [Candidatus Puniceispirillaceae bacterium]
MRIIAGRHRGTRLAKPAGAETRPTADRVRESLFNILAGGRFGEVVEGIHVIDAFAGTGALGLEALSRGAAHASFIERDQAALATLRANIARLKRGPDCRVIAGDALTLAAWRGMPAGLLLADAPYGTEGGLRAAAQLMSIGALAGNALLVIETERGESLDADAVDRAGLRQLDDRTYGRARLHFLRREA